MSQTLVKRALTMVVAALVALLLTSLLIRLAGRSPAHIYALMLAGTWGNRFGIGQVLFKSTPLMLTGLSVAFARRAGLFNVGAEGQIIVGAFACALCGAYLPSATPAILAVPACLVAAAAGGAALGALAGWLRASRGVHEVISTIMLNFVVRAAMVGLGAVFFLRESVHTKPILPAAALPRLARFVPALVGSAANLSLLLCVVAVVCMRWLIVRTRLGARIRAVGAQPMVAASAGIAVGRIAIVSFLIAGALAGLGGANFVLGYKGYYEDGFSGGVGFVGIAVAELGGMSALGIIASALLFGTLSQGAFTVNAACPKEIIDVMIALIIVAAAVSLRREARA